jgi:hypothetical protein
VVHFLPNQQEDQAEAEGASKRQHSEQKCLREGEKRQVVQAAASKRDRGFLFLRSKLSRKAVLCGRREPSQPPFSNRKKAKRDNMEKAKLTH